MSINAQMLEVILFVLAGVWQGIRQDWNLLEIALVGALLGWGVARLAGRKFPYKPLIRLARRPVLASFVLAALAVAIRLALLPVMPVPIPIVSDEFSHLLLADTLLNGRLANPPPPFWQHFESLQILVTPRYVSNYFPGQAAILALAIRIAGQPWLGILTLSAAFCAAVYWALAGWMPRRWALAGGLLALLRFSIASYWVNAYHGGFLPGIGGALALGACGRLRRRPTAASGCVFASGLAILAFTRPFEGALFALPLVVATTWRLRTLVPMAVILGLTILTLGFYLRQVTGSPFRTAYSISQATYGWPMTFLWSKPKPVPPENIELARYYQYELDEHQKVNSIVHFVQYSTFRLQEYWRFFLGPALSVPLVMLPFVWRRKKLRVLFAAVAAALLAVMLEGAASPHYLSPATALIVLLTIECFRQLSVKARGAAIATGLAAVMPIVLAFRIAAAALGLPYTQDLNYQSWCCRVEGNHEKARLTAALSSQAGAHLVFVQEKKNMHNLFQWIYNPADLDRAKILWVRDLGLEANRRLADHYPARRVWLVDPNVQPAAIFTYDPKTQIQSQPGMLAERQSGFR